MKTVLSAFLLLLLATAPGIGAALAADAETPPQSPAGAAKDGSAELAPADAKPAADADETSKDEDVMQKVTRHRPGACPEGPPCKSGD